MSVAQLSPKHNLQQEREDLAATFRWTARLNMHEGVANHYSLAVNEDGTQFLMNPNQMHFSLIKASDLLLLDANDPSSMEGPDAPDPTAWGLHGTIHRHLPHARCAMHVHSIYATVIAMMEDSSLPPFDQNSAMFFNRVAIDTEYGGLAFEEEAQRCCQLLADPSKQVLVMGNHGIMVVGATVADTFNRLYYFERAAETYVKALWTGKPLRRLSDEVAEKTAREIESYPEQGDKLMIAIRQILERDGEDFRL
ncbi:class II aldolase and adducin N-terminal domain-containing protein [Oceanicella sp. SM1341]|uniref:class II aldolase and adducin N-terminal domain-containing protein n=1 Tax=Oceanicella sp. SM1341 TaxID=1548889 RepID=UPI000E476BA4|nr:class II aldolase and adducin N-terminal domain-containing protein [Oceanicella sp. SM1341]